MRTDNTYSYAGRPIVDRTPMPGDRLLIITASTHSMDPWATGYLGEDDGKHFAAGEADGRDLGLVVGPAGSVLVPPVDVERVQERTAELAKAHDDFEKTLRTENCDDGTRLNAEGGIAEEAMVTAALMRELGLYKPTESEPEPDIEAMERKQQYTTETCVEAVTNGENWNK
ncbi:hypothetical protein [Streptomyces sp. NPDC048142]|uniref:hypothetical protein n=1 Tax=Streptomyces sp. NPDC048142 TaxID=3365501 RepID=UPI00371F88F3